MGTHWQAVVVAAALALAVAWQRRHTWTTPNLGPPTQALALHAVGLLMISPVGEPYGDLNKALLGFENCEDILGHTLFVWSSFLIAARAFQTLGWKQHIPTLVCLAKIATALILAAAWATDLVHTPSRPGDAGDSAYWSVALYLVAPAFAIAVWANLLVSVDSHARRFNRTMGAAHAVTFTVGFAGCISRFFIPSATVTYWLFAVSMFGMTAVCWCTWRNLVRPVRQLVRTPAV